VTDPQMTDPLVTDQQMTDPRVDDMACACKCVTVSRTSHPTITTLALSLWLNQN